MDIPESQKRSKQKVDFRRSVEKIVADHHLVRVRDEEDGLGEDHSADLISDLWHRISLEINDVLVSPGLVDVAIAVDPEVKLLAV